MCKVYTDVCRWYKLVIHAPCLSTCTGDYPLAEALRLSPRTVGQTIARPKRIFIYIFSISIFLTIFSLYQLVKNYITRTPLGFFFFFFDNLPQTDEH